VVGQVTSEGVGAFGMYRMWEYTVVHSIYKPASALMQAMIVCPGCATIYAAKVLEQYRFSGDTKAEDMDYTFLLHRKNAGVMVYEDGAEVLTTDPLVMGDYVNQLHRWYTGFWQAVVKHNIPWGGQMLDIEASLFALEGLFSRIVIDFVVLPIIILVVCMNVEPARNEIC